MNKKLVIDTSVYITYAAYNKIYRLVDAIATYELQVYISHDLFKEIEDIADCLQVKVVDPLVLLLAIKQATIFAEVSPEYSDSPDPKDNFLFDLALQTGSEIIVTQEKALLNFATSPVPIHNLKWFKEHYPVPL